MRTPPVALITISGDVHTVTPEMNVRQLILASFLPLAVTGCGSGGKPAAETTNAKVAKPGAFTAEVDNPWLPLAPGTIWVYRGVKDGRPARDVVTATSQTKVIQGAPCRAIRDRLYLSGRLEERTTDWYTQDRAGDVWYYGEATAELDKNGRVKSTEGSWQAGVDGAKPGIFMPAVPKVGQTFRQEYYKGQAEDHFQVRSLAATVKVPYLTSMHAMLTKEWTPLEPDVIDHKLYVRGIGTVREETVKGPTERLVLVSMRRR